MIEKILWYFMHLVNFHHWTGKILKGIPINERLCPLCKTKHIVGEFHYIIECSAISQVRLCIKKNLLDLFFLLNFCTCWHWCKIIKKTVCLLQNIWGSLSSKSFWPTVHVSLHVYNFSHFYHSYIYYLFCISDVHCNVKLLSLCTICFKWC